jgi:hypothetical protein
MVPVFVAVLNVGVLWDGLANNKMATTMYLKFFLVVFMRF